MKYQINDPWDWITHFEKEVSEYCGYKYAVACDSNSNAIRLVLHYLNITNSEIIIPAHTYVSVPNQIILSGNTPVFQDIEWDGLYPLGDTNIIDAATAFHKDMSGGYEDKYMILSFHLKKILNIGQGGMILTNDEKFNEWARPMIYDGRHKDRMYDDDEFECVGWHMYMSPESAKRGLEIFNSEKIQENNQSVGGSWKYKDLRTQKIYRDKYSLVSTFLNLTYLIDDESHIITPEYHNLNTTLRDIIKQSIDTVNISESPLYKLFMHYKEYLIKGYVIKIYEHTEGHDFEKIAIGDVSKNTLCDVINYFKKNNTEITHDFFKIRNGNLYYPYFSKNKKYYEPTLLGFFDVNSYEYKIDSNENVDEFTLNKKIKKKFLYMNRIPKFNRGYLFNEIWKSDRNILDNSYWSWNSKGRLTYPFYEESHPIKSLEGLSVTTDDNTSTNFFAEEYIKTSFCSIITESEWNDTSLFFSEKIVKPILYCQPFIVFGSRNYYKMLHKLGFKTFSKYWSEGFDDISSIDDNIGPKGESILSTINYINDLSIQELQTLHIDMIDILIHNRRILFDIFNSNIPEFKTLTTYDKVSKFLNTEDKKYHFKIDNII